MAKFMHQVMMRATKATIQVTHYIVLSCDEVFTIDNQFLFHYYAVNNWVNIYSLIYLDWVVVGLRIDKLTKVIMEVLMIGDDLS
jgi:hypothetical protein